MSTTKKCLRAAAIIIVLLDAIWLVENWSVMPELLDLGFKIPVKEFIIFGLGFLACYIIGRLNSEAIAVKAAKAKGTAQVESAKADMIEQRKKATPVAKARARMKADIASARADAIEA